MPAQCIRIVTVDDHPVSRAGIKALLAENANLEVVAEGWLGEQVEPLVENHQPDILLLDLKMRQYADPDRTENFQALVTISRLHARWPNMHIIVLSAYINLSVVQGAFERGVRGYILKDDFRLIGLGSLVEQTYHGRIAISNAIQDMLLKQSQGQSVCPTLTSTQLHTVNVVAADLNAPDSEHATTLGITPSSLRNRLSKIYTIMGTNNRASCIVKCMRYGLITLDQAYYQN